MCAIADGLEENSMGNNNENRRPLILVVALTLVILTVHPYSMRVALAASAREIDSSVTRILTALYQKKPDAKVLADKAVAMLVFPSIVKGGFIIGGQFGDGALRKHGQTVAYYRSVAASYGFQAGVQTFGYVLFFMDEGSVQYLDNSAGWELGSGPSLVVLDEGFGKVLSTTTLQKGVYALIFNQKGLMGGVGLQGSKITKINPNP
jgi:lipid-binding SYLF domain-containing protein